LWLQTYPRGEEPPKPQDLLAGLSTHGTGRFERAIEASQKEVATDPDIVFGYNLLASSNFFLDRFDEAERALQRATERKLQTPNLLMIRYNIAVLKGDKDRMDRTVALAKGKRGAVWEAVCGNAAHAKQNAMAALELSNGRDVEYAAGLALALSGDSSRSQPLADDLEKRFPEDTFARFTYVPVLRALSALEHGKPPDSVARLQVSLPYELAVNGLDFGFYLGGLHSAYVRGEALAAAHRYPEAVAEYQKILTHPGIVSADPIGALAHWQLGRAFVLSGDQIKGRAAYQDFLTLWKDADSDNPVLRQAKAEYANLQ
jgi:tetratricopeptide (TPR) repeat protein